MDPKQQFQQRYQEYVSKQPTAYVTPKKAFFNKFYVQGLLVGLVIVVSGVLVYLNFKPGTPPPPQANKIVAVPSPTPKAAITVTDAQIDLEMQRIWGEYYQKVKDDPKLKDLAKKNLIKRLSLETAVSKYNIDLSSIASDNPGEKDLQSEQEVAKKVLSWRNIDYAYVYIDPTNPKYKDYPEKAIYSYSLIKANLEKGDSFKDAYTTASKDPKFFKPIVAYYNKLFFKNDWGKNVSQELFKHTKGQTTDLIAPSAGGVYVLAYINDSNDTQFATMDEWIKSQTQ
ncbi:MAG: hypothetical protein ACM3IJ_00765 [Candidatus Levyibacteriota bacterium]